MRVSRIVYDRYRRSLQESRMRHDPSHVFSSTRIFHFISANTVHRAEENVTKAKCDTGTC